MLRENLNKDDLIGVKPLTTLGNSTLKRIFGAEYKATCFTENDKAQGFGVVLSAKEAEEFFSEHANPEDFALYVIDHLDTVLLGNREQKIAVIEYRLEDAFAVYELNESAEPTYNRPYGQDIYQRFPSIGNYTASCFIATNDWRDNQDIYQLIKGYADAAIPTSRGVLILIQNSADAEFSKMLRAKLAAQYGEEEINGSFSWNNDGTFNQVKGLEQKDLVPFWCRMKGFKYTSAYEKLDEIIKAIEHTGAIPTFQSVLAALGMSNADVTNAMQFSKKYCTEGII